MTEHHHSETELLLCCASPPGHFPRTERIRELSGQTLDWPWLFRTAAVHSLAPLVYWGLKAVRPEAIPAPLEQSFQQNAANSVWLTGELLKLMLLFAREGIGILPVKGPTLAIAAYGNLALRQFSDLDLMVRKADVLRAREILLRNGYSSTLNLNPKWHAAYLRGYDEFGLLGPEGYPLVELHWAVTPHFFSVPLDIGPFWDRAVTVKLGGRDVPSLRTDDLLLVLCLHATKHCWSHLSMVSDVAWLLAQEIQWDEVVEKARDLGSLRMLLLGVELARKLLGVPLPELVTRSIEADRDVQPLALQVIDRMFQEPAIQEPDGLGARILGAGILHMRAREHWRDRARYLVRLATNVGVEDWQAVDLPPWLACLYPIVRYPRLLQKYWLRTPKPTPGAFRGVS